ncbi:MAG: VWA domain-containing protein [Myxococcales bacterium]|nr:MAG: VWA domain-containing protein [Myxococcales bacterium]
MNGNQGGSGNTGTGGGQCSAEFAATKLRPVRLAFAFDISGSMGKGDEEWHDPELKWRPVVAATRAFFEDPASTGVSASLSFFPDEDESDRCEASTYAEPDVAMTELPSDAFGEAIAVIDPDEGAKWRGGTPTLAVVQGNTEYLLAQIDAAQDAAHALVLVTDGYPQGCDSSEDDISAVEAAITEASAQFPTYVIGVRNPEGKGGPDTVSDLNVLAVAGGTEAAIFIDTGDPDQTAADLNAAIDRIRESSITCDAPIPPAPAGSRFDPELVNLSAELAGDTSELTYDADCEGDLAWRFDDEANPTTIVLCPSTCDAVQGDSTAKLSVGFGCVRRDVVK